MSDDNLSITKTYTKTESQSSNAKVVEIIDKTDSTNKSKVQFSLNVDLDAETLFISAFWSSQIVDDPDEQKINKENGIYASNDGATWKFLGMTPLQNRDMSIMYKNGIFYATATTTSADTGEVSFDIYKSTDLVNWTNVNNSTYKIPVNNFKNKNGTTKEIPQFTKYNQEIYTDADRWVSATISTWGPKWVIDKDGKYYLVFTVTDTTVSNRAHNYWTVYILPVNDFGTLNQEENLNYQNIVFGQPIDLNLYNSDGSKSVEKTSDFSDSKDYGHIGPNIIYNQNNNNYYCFIKDEATVEKDSKLQVYKASSIKSDKWVQVTDNMNFNDTEKANICIDSTNQEYKCHFEGNYVLNLANKNVFMTDHYARWKASLNTYDTTIGGMYYSTIDNTLSCATNPKPISILNTEYWKAAYLDSSIGTNVLRNATIYKVENPNAREVVKEFASNQKFTYTYSDGLNEITKSVNVSEGIHIPVLVNKKETDTKTTSMKITSNRPLNENRIPANWTLEEDGISISKQFSNDEANGTIYLRDRINESSPSAIPITVDKCLTVALPQEIYKYTGAEIKPKVTVTWKGNEISCNVIYENNINPGLAKCIITSDEFAETVYATFEIKQLAPTDVKLNLKQDNTVIYQWQPSDTTDILGYYAHVYKLNQNGNYDSLYETKLYGEKKDDNRLVLPEVFEKDSTYKINFCNRKFNGRDSTDVLNSTVSSIIIKPSEHAVSLSSNGITVEAGKDLIFTANGTGQNLKYAFLYKPHTTTTWLYMDNNVKGYNNGETTCALNVKEPGIYDVLVKAKQEENGGDIVVSDIIENVIVTEDKTAPTLEVTGNATEWTKNNVTLTIKSGDNESGVKSVTVNGTNVSMTNGVGTYTVTENGTYTIIATDNVNNTTTKTIQISKTKHLGDINEDGTINLVDILKIMQYISYIQTGNNADKWALTNEEKITADVNQDGSINIIDLLKIKRYMAAQKSQTIASRHPEWLNM